VFEFLKKTKAIDNSSVKKDDYMVSKLNDGGSYGVSYFITNYERLQINNWLKDVGVESISFSDILGMLDFDKDKKLWLERIPSEKDEISFSFKYVDETFYNDLLDEWGRITIYKNFVNHGGNKSYKIKVFNNNYELLYYLWMDKNVLKLKLEENYIKENVNDKIYMRKGYDGGFRIKVKNNYDEILLVCKKRDVSQVDNEDKLKEYLLNIDGNVSVREIYKKICEISLGNEDHYEKIELSLIKDNQIVENVEKYDKRYFGNIGPDYRCDILKDGKRCIFICDSDSESKIIKFVKDNYIIIIRMCDCELFNDKIALRDYFMDLENPIKIHELCIDFRDKFLYDFDHIPYFKIEFYIDNTYRDNLFIKNGKVCNFEMILDDKKLLVNEDGKFCYLSSSSCGEVEVDMSMDRDVVTKYQIELDEGIENDDMGNVMYNIINKAKDEKVRTKKMIDKMLKRDNS